MKRYWRTLIRCLRQDDRIYESVAELDALFLRKNPPVVHQSLEFLEPVSEQVFIINSTRGQLLASRMLYTLHFPDLIPETHISRDPARLRRVIDDFGGTVVVKPMERYGGEGVIKVSAHDPDNLNSLIHYYVKASEAYPNREAIVVQEYLGAVKDQGVVRVLLLNGEVVGAMKREPEQGDFRANAHCLSEARAHVVTLEERRTCRAVQERLIADGLFFVGIDLIGGKLVGIDCLNPGGIPCINRLHRVNLESKVVDFVEQQVRERDQAQGCWNKTVSSPWSDAPGVSRSFGTGGGRP